MSIAEKLTTIAENQQAVYDAGKQADRDAFWDEIQDYGNRTAYQMAFKYWGSEYTRPKYKIATADISDLNNTFMYCKNLKKVESAYFDFSNHPTGSSANSQSANYLFYGCNNLEEIEDIGIPAESYYYYAFMQCGKLHTIAVIRSTATTWFTDAFNSCYALANVTFEGVVGQNINLSWSTKLSHDSIMSLINCLETKSGETKTVTLGTTNLAKLTDAEKAIATEKGWTLA
jgi:hypothetical protein